MSETKEQYIVDLEYMVSGEIPPMATIDQLHALRGSVACLNTMIGNRDDEIARLLLERARLRAENERLRALLEGNHG